MSDPNIEQLEAEENRLWQVFCDAQETHRAAIAAANKPVEDAKRDWLAAHLAKVNGKTRAQEKEEMRAEIIAELANEGVKAL